MLIHVQLSSHILLLEFNLRFDSFPNLPQVKRWNKKRLSIQQRKARVVQRKALFLVEAGALKEAAGDAEDMDSD
jgi:hypothetical protein